MVNNIRDDYEKLLDRTKDLIILQSVESIIHWDMETKMPPRAVEQRSQQLALIYRLIHKLGTAPEIGKLSTSILRSPQYEMLNQVEKRNVYLIKKNYDEQTALPEKLVGEIAKQQTITVNTWKKAKKAKSFSMLKPELGKLVTLNKEAAQILMKVKNTATPYDALIDSYEPKMTADTITMVFSQLRNGLKTLLEKIQNTEKQLETSAQQIRIPAENQRQIAQALTQALGYDTISSTAGSHLRFLDQLSPVFVLSAHIYYPHL